MFIDCNDPAEWEFLLAKTKISPGVAEEILESLKNLGAIDEGLWSKKVVFCQNLVDGVSDAFKRRLTHLPTLSGVYERINSVNVDMLQTKTGKGKERKLKETKRDKTKSDFILPDWIPSDNWNAFLEMRKKRDKSELSDYAKKLAVNKLQKLKDDGHDPGEVLDQTTFGKWAGLYPIKDGGGNSNGREEQDKPAGKDWASGSRVLAGGNSDL